MRRRYRDDNGVERVPVRATPARATSLADEKIAGMTPVGTSGDIWIRVTRNRGPFLGSKI
jgi:hypothetical protein